MDKAVVIGAGNVDGLSYTIKEGDFIVCADGGYDNALKLGFVPDVLIGDFDSIKCVPEGFETVRLSPKKDYTDMHMAALYAIERGYTELDMLCALGTRFDHSLSNVYLLKHLYENGVRARIIGAHNILQVTGGALTLKGCMGKTVSILPLGGAACGITLTGFEYPFVGGTMECGVSIGISNVVTDDVAVIEVKKGILLVDIVDE